MSPEKSAIIWTQRARLGGVETFRVGRAGSKVVAEWPGTARLTCEADGLRPHLQAHPSANVQRLKKVRSGAVPALLRDLQGELAMHASAVSLDTGAGKRALLLVGPSGVGKSTVAADLCMHHGAALLADDIATLEVRDASVRVVPSERHHHLTSKSMRLVGVASIAVRSSGKTALRAKRAARAPVTLATIAILRFDDRRTGPGVTALGGAAAARALLRSVVRFDVAARRARELDQVLALYRLCRIVDVARPRKRSSGVQVSHVLQSALMVEDAR